MIKTLQEVKVLKMTFVFVINAIHAFFKKNEILQVIFVQKCMKLLVRENSNLENVNGK